jgi:hypothetical protein
MVKDCKIEFCLAGSYHDNFSNQELAKIINSGDKLEEELARLNKWTSVDYSKQELLKMLKCALRTREENGQC